MAKGFIDLHIHTKASDGKLTPAETILTAHNNKVSVISLTEHYNLGSYKQARQIINSNPNYEIELIPGIEIGASLLDLGYSKNHICHILAYYPSYSICKILDEYELSRENCVRKTLEKLKKYIDISYSQVLKYARNKKSIGRFDIAIAISKLGYSVDPIAAYGEFLDTGKSCYVDRQKLSCKDLISKIRDCHGVPVLAHPKSLKMNHSELETLLFKLKEFGLEGIEVFNPHHTDEQISFFKELAIELNLATTVGSDYHGKSQDKIELGKGINSNLCIDDYSIIEDLKQRHNLIISK